MGDLGHESNPKSVRGHSKTADCDIEQPKAREGASEEDGGREGKKVTGGP
jgi:hypothetical protein